MKNLNCLTLVILMLIVGLILGYFFNFSFSSEENKEDIRTSPATGSSGGGNVCDMALLVYPNSMIGGYPDRDMCEKDIPSEEQKVKNNLKQQCLNYCYKSIKCKQPASIGMYYWGNLRCEFGTNPNIPAAWNIITIDLRAECLCFDGSELPKND